MKKIITKSENETKKLGRKIARKILKKGPKKTAMVLALKGDLGGGKTTFLKGFAEGLGIEEKILSPTFIIMKKFSISNSQFSNFYHFDCYRISKAKEILNLGFKEIVENPKNIVAIEWAERVEKILPKKVIHINFKFLGKKGREILIKWEKDC